METFQAIRSRQSTRAFLADPVPHSIFEEILDACRWAPSSRNIQPWTLVVVGGAAMTAVRAFLTEKAESRASAELDIPAPPYPEPYSHRALANREAIDAHQFPPGTEELDRKRAEFWVRGGRFHDAPNAILICLEKELCPHTLVEAGIMAQTICLAAHARGLGTCLMRRPVWFPERLREVLDIPRSSLLILGIAIGYPDAGALINSHPRYRLPVNDFTLWRGL